MRLKVLGFIVLFLFIITIIFIYLGPYQITTATQTLYQSTKINEILLPNQIKYFRNYTPAVLVLYSNNVSLPISIIGNGQQVKVENNYIVIFSNSEVAGLRNNYTFPITIYYSAVPIDITRQVIFTIMAGVFAILTLVVGIIVLIFWIRSRKKG
jgi:hypothetical protein